ncbi:MAG: hypothetical protein ABIP39_04090, partial [Polyangiaceae bacterium]
MQARRMAKLGAWVVAGLLSAGGAHASPRSFVTIRDDGFLSGKITSPDAITKKIVPLYTATGSAIPDVLSVWTTFPMDGGIVETLFDPVGNDIQGIGLEQSYGGDGTIVSTHPPLRAILLHNDFTKMQMRADAQNAPVDGLAQYLFLLELSHTFGPALRLGTNDAGGDPSGLIGFDFHWSFWMDAGSSPAGGNSWKDNGDGTFTVNAQSPKTVKYTMLDLYLMGLADPSEVTPFGLIEHAAPPAGVKDPFTGKAYAAHSFPYWGATPFTATGTHRTITIDEVIAANGPRIPAKAPSSTLNVGFVMVVPASASDDEVAAFEAQFEPLASTFGPAYHDA